MKSIADQLPPEIARQLHPDRRKNEAEYWAVRDQLLDQYKGPVDRLCRWPGDCVGQQPGGRVSRSRGDRAAIRSSSALGGRMNRAASVEHLQLRRQLSR